MGRGAPVPTDGRLHPWGDAFDPTFCLMRTSRPRERTWSETKNEPEPITRASYLGFRVARALPRRR